MGVKSASGLNSLARALGRGANSVLSRSGIRLDYLRNDFDDRPLDEYTRHRLMKTLARTYETWMASQTIFRAVGTFDTGSAINVFYENWLVSPFRGQQGGSRFNNLLWLHLIARSIKPDIIIDSGTFQGASAWALSLGSPGSTVLSFDIDLSHVRLKAAGVTYVPTDWSSHSFDHLGNARILAYFDDHVDQIRRLIEAAKRRCEIVIFDDDFPVSSYFGMAPDPSVLPKIEFALDSELSDGQVLRWIANGAEHSFTIKRAYLDQGRDLIAATERLPNTSLITGIHQTPYRIIAVRSRERAA